MTEPTVTAGTTPAAGTVPTAPASEATAVPVPEPAMPQPSVPQLHVPDEPVVMKAVWRDAVLDGADLAEIVTGGVAGWLWSRWRALESAGFTEAGFERLVGDYRREIWLWLHGDRTWEQCCSGLIGRIGRRVPS
ncbi:MAG TPA: hypothetical protein VHX40_06635 [Acidimicrobiales bacterium]|nr:hypothetical protein [Acidimicrobiales bacterium]